MFLIYLVFEKGNCVGAIFDEVGAELAQVPSLGVNWIVW